MPVQLFFACAAEDRAHLDALTRHLAALERSGVVAGWHEGQVLAGGVVDAEVTARLATADALVVLVSADFIASDRCHALVERALVRHDDRRLRVVPIIVRPCDWRALMGGLRVLPHGGQPVTSIADRDGAWLEVVQGLRDVFTASTPPLPPALAATPYRGLSAFQPDDESLFFGREELVRRLWRRLDGVTRREGALRLLGIVGPSGSGKSSVARAGLVPLVEREPPGSGEAPEVVIFKPGELPVEALGNALLASAPSWSERSPAERMAESAGLRAQLLEREEGEHVGLRRYALLRGSTRPLLVLVDQFEEIYALGKQPAERDAFVALLLNAASARDGAVSVVLTLRSDFLDDTRHHPALNRAIADAHELVPVMLPAELRRAIASPAAASGRPLDEAAVELLVRDAEGREGALPLLEFTLERIWQGIQQGRPPIDTLTAIGGVGGALAGEAEQIFGELDTTGKKIARRAFCGLVQLGESTRDTRRRVLVRDLVAHGEETEAVLDVLRKFASPRARLVTLSSDAGEELAEITHEALLEHWQKLRDWTSEDRESLRFHRRLADAAKRWDEEGRPSGLVWRSPDFNRLRDYQKRDGNELTSLDFVFFEACIKLDQDEKDDAARSARLGRRNAVIFKVASMVLALLVALALLFRWREQTAKASAVAAHRQAEISGIMAVAERERVQGHNTEVAALLRAAAELGREQGSMREALEGGLLAAGNEPLSFVVPTGPSVPKEVVASAEGAVFVQLTDGIVLRVDLKTGVAKTIYNIGATASSVLTRDGSRIAFLNENLVRVVALDTGRELGHWQSLGQYDRVSRFSRDGSLLISSAQLWRMDGTAVTQVALQWPDHRLEDLSPDLSTVILSRESPTPPHSRPEDITKDLPENTQFSRAIVLPDRGCFPSTTFSTDGTQLATSNGQSRASVLSIANNEQANFKLATGGCVVAVDFAAEERLLVIASGGNTAPGVYRVSDALRKKDLRIPYSAEQSAAAYAASTLTAASQSRIPFSSYEADVPLIGTLGGNGDNAYSVASYGSHGVITTSESRMIRSWDLSPLVEMTTLVQADQGLSWGTAHSADGSVIAVSGNAGLAIWSSLRPTTRIFRAKVDTVDVSANGRRVAAVSDRRIYVWNTSNLEQMWMSPTRTRESISTVRLSPSGDRLAWSIGGPTHIVDVMTGRQIAVSSCGRSIVTFSEQVLVTSCQDDSVIEWDVDHDILARKLTSAIPDLSALDLSLDNRLLAAHTNTNDVPSSIIELFDLRDGSKRSLLRGHTSGILTFKFSPDSKYLVSGAFDGTARVWDPSSGAAISVLVGQQGIVDKIAISQDGQLAAIADSGYNNEPPRSIRVFAIPGGWLVRELRNLPESVEELFFTPDGGLRYVGKEGSIFSWSELHTDVNREIVRIGGRTNLRVCRETFSIVPVVPFPEPGTVWAPADACRVSKGLDPSYDDKSIPAVRDTPSLVPAGSADHHVQDADVKTAPTAAPDPNADFEPDTKTEPTAEAELAAFAKAEEARRAHPELFVGGSVLVVGVRVGGQGHQQGIAGGDVIIGYDGKRISDSEQLLQAVKGASVAKMIRVDILRGPQKRTFIVHGGFLGIFLRDLPKRSVSSK